MKRIIIVGLLLILCIGIFFLPRKSEESNESYSKKNDKTYSAEEMYTHIRNATIQVPEESMPVALTDGTGSIIYGPGASERTEVWILDNLYQKADRFLAIIMALHTGGTGVFHWLVLYEMRDDTTFIKIDEAPLGDRIRVNYLGLSTDTLRVGIMQHGEQQSFSEEPNVQEELRYTFKNNALQQSE